MCFGDSNGVAIVSITGGTLPYSLLWNDPLAQTTDTALNLPPGTYSLVVNDSNGCIATAIVSISEPADMTILATSSSTSCFGDCDGSAMASVAGGTSPYLYLWDDTLSQTSSTATMLCAGNYSVLVTDNNGCTKNASTTVTQPLALSLSSGAIDATCAGNDGLAYVAVTNGTQPYLYLWDDPSAQTTDSAMNLSVGTYVVIVTDLNSCTASDTVTITNAGASQINLTWTNISCNGLFDGTATSTPIGGLPPYTYSWSNGDSTNMITGLANGLFIITVTDSTGCASVDTANIIEPAALTDSMVTTDISCNGATHGNMPNTFIFLTKNINDFHQYIGHVALLD